MSGDADDPIVQEFFGVPLRRSQVARMNASEQALREIRVRAEFRPRMDAGPTSGIGVNCARCEHLGDFSDEGARGHCMIRSAMVATWHNCECKLFEPKTRPKGHDLIKEAVAAGERERLALLKKPA